MRVSISSVRSFDLQHQSEREKKLSLVYVLTYTRNNLSKRQLHKVTKIMKNV